MKRYTTPHALAMLNGFRPPLRGLEAFYRWAKRLGHYSAHEAVARYRKIANGT